MNKLLFVVLCSACAVAGPDDSEDSTIDSPLTGGVTLTEVSVPSAVTDALIDDLHGDAPAVRRFTISAPNTTSVADRVRGAMEGLFFRTRKGGSFSVKKYCAKLPSPETTAAGCANAVLTRAAKPGAFDLYLDDMDGEWTTSVTTVRAYLSTTLGPTAYEHELTVDVGHEEDGEWWRDYTAVRPILFDASASQVVVVRYVSAGSW